MSAPVTNLLRAHWAEVAIRAFQQEAGCDLEDSLGDLLANLMHWAEARGFSFDLAFQRAAEHFTIEHAEAGA